MNKPKIIIILIFLALLLATVFVYLKISTISFDQRAKAYLAWFNPSDANLDNYYEVTESADYLKTIGASDKTFNSNEEVFDFLRDKSKTSTKAIYSVLKTPREAKIPIDFKEESGIDVNLPEKISYITPGQLGYEVYSYDLLLFSPNKDTLSSKYLNVDYKVIDPVSKKFMSGGKKVEAAKKETENMFTSFIKNLNDKTTLKDKDINLSDANLKKIDNKEVLENISINNISFVEKAFKEDDLKTSKDSSNTNKTLVIGSINIHLENCFKDFSQDLVFSVEEGEIKFGDVNKVVSALCKKQFIKVSGVLTGTCKDCTYYPADKTHALSQDYTPEVEAIDFAPGGQSINKIAYADFKELYNAALKDEVHIYVTSGYRSYGTQVGTFESWVQTELASGYSRSQAEAIANTYSALPGFSEHQLGTALDLNGAGCEISDGYCSSNESIWNWLARNAYKYGFIQSYPAGKQSETGYTSEEWHYRWIGKDLALEYKNAGGGDSITLNKFLFEKGNY